MIKRLATSKDSIFFMVYLWISNFTFLLTAEVSIVGSAFGIKINNFHKTKPNLSNSFT
jgi:hypothetical protein